MFQRQTTLRPMTAEDREFLRHLYATTRQSEMDLLDWSKGQKNAFLCFQFDAQSSHYAAHFPDATFDVVELDGQAIGRLYVDRRSDEIRIVDIALLPEVRGEGLGGELLAQLLREGEEKRLLVRIHVEHNNPAMRLYRRLSFEKIEEQGVYWLMEWTPRSLKSIKSDRPSLVLGDPIS